MYGPIQDFLNSFFKDIYEPIPLVYNLVLAMLWRHPENVELEKVKVVHYCARGSKPWRYTGQEENMDRDDIKMLVKKWWDVYDNQSLNYRAVTNYEEEGDGKKGSVLAVPAIMTSENNGTAKLPYIIRTPSAA